VVNHYNGRSAMVWVQFFGDKSSKWIMHTDCGMFGPIITSNNGIVIDINFKRDSVCKSKAEARERLNHLIKNVPAEIKSEFMEHVDCLFEVVK
jgi:hypothetical protein